MSLRMWALFLCLIFFGPIVDGPKQSFEATLVSVDLISEPQRMTVTESPEEDNPRTYLIKMERDTKIHHQDSNHMLSINQLEAFKSNSQSPVKLKIFHAKGEKRVNGQIVKATEIVITEPSS